jgi:maleate isomerase
MTHRRDVLRLGAAVVAALPAGALAHLPVKSTLVRRQGLAPIKRSQSLTGHKIVGLILPTMRSGTVIDLVPLLPRGVGLLPIYLAFRAGTEDEFKKGFDEYEKKIAILADHGCDLIHPEGAPPFMVRGLTEETALLSAWQRKYRIPMFTSGQNHIHALHALDVKSIFGATYFTGRINDLYAKYFEDAGFEVHGMQGLEGVEFSRVQDVPSSQIYDLIKAGFQKNPAAKCIYMLGSGWRTLDIVERLEQELGVPVVHPQTARAWEIRKRLQIEEPMQGFGMLMAKLPPLRDAI